jgi:cell division protein FtsL
VLMGPRSFLVLVVGCVAMGMFLVYQRATTRMMQYESGALQMQVLQLAEQNRRLKSETSALKSPAWIATKARAMGLGLVDPSAPHTAVSEAKPEKKEQVRGAVASAHSPR